MMKVKMIVRVGKREEDVPDVSAAEGAAPEDASCRFCILGGLGAATMV